MKRFLRALLPAIFLPVLLTAQIDNHGGVWAPPQPQAPCISDAAWQAIDAEVTTRIKQWTEQGRFQPAADNIVYFNWPVRPKSGFGYPGYYGIANFIDEDPGSGVLDYNCGSRSYNGHKGTDISNWPFAWTMMDSNDVEVVAAAAGTIVAKYDGRNDQECSWNNQSGNGIILLHPDGTRSWYWHFKKYTLTAKSIGSSVAQGEFLGLVGSSGISTGPHLHFEVQGAGGTTIDPWAGSCNNLGGQSWWTDQKPYYDPYILRIMTHDSVPEMNDCPPDFPHAADVFQPGERVYFSSYFRDRQAGSTASYSVKQPNGAIWKSWTQTPTSTYSFYYWYWWYTLPVNAQQGTWTFSLTANGQTETHTFTVGTASGVSNPEALGFSNLRVYPNPAREQLFLDIDSQQAGVLWLWLYSSDGALIKAGPEYEISGGASKLAFALPEEAPHGVYFLKIITEKGALTKCVLMH